MVLNYGIQMYTTCHRWVQTQKIKMQSQTLIWRKCLFASCKSYTKKTITCTWIISANLLNFSLLACYIPNVANRSNCTYDISVRSIYWGPTGQWPTDRPTSFGKISNGHISARGHPIHFMFGSMVGFSSSADRMALFPVSPNPRWRLGRNLEKFKFKIFKNSKSLRQIIRFTLCLVLGWGFWGRRIEWHYFQFHQNLHAKAGCLWSNVNIVQL